MGSIIVLAGGKSTRMGHDKAIIKLSGKTLIEHVVEKAYPLTDEMIIVANDQHAIKQLAGIRDKRMIYAKDILMGAGPLAGIHAGLSISSNEYNLVLGCDMPFIDPELIKEMLLIEGYDAVVPLVDDKMEPLHAIYSKRCIPTIQKMLETNTLKINGLFQQIDVKFLNIGQSRCFYNVNSRSDLDGCEVILHEKEG